MPDQQADPCAHAWLTNAPVALLALAADGRVRWANRALEAVVGLPAAQLLGHTRDSLPSPAHRVLFGTGELIHLKGPGAPERWLRCQVSEPGDGVRLYCYSEVGREIALAEQNRRLAGEIEGLRTTDTLTGLPNRRALAQQLELHVSRSRRYHNPLSLVHVELQVQGPDGAGDAAMLAMARHLRERLRWVDQVARWDERQFLLVLPETAEAEAREVAASLLAPDDIPPLPASIGTARIDLYHGVSSWQQGDDSRTLRERAVTDSHYGARVSNG